MNNLLLIAIFALMALAQSQRIWRSYQPLEEIDITDYLAQYERCRRHDSCQRNVIRDIFGSRNCALRDFSGVVLDAQYPEHAVVINERYSQDFGGVVSRTPEVVFLPSTTEDVAFIVSKARQHGWSLTIKGGSGNAGGATLSDTYVLDMSNLNDVAVSGSPKTVTAGAGATIQEIIDFLHDPVSDFDFRLPVIPDYTGITIGGVVSIGGVGPHTPFQGAVVDTVVSLTVVLDDGAVIKCSATENTACFNAVRAGMGQFGVITEVELPIVKNFPLYRIIHLVTDDAQLYFDTFKTLTTASPFAIDGLQSFVLPANLASIQTTFVDQTQIPGSDIEELLNVTEKAWLHIIEVTVHLDEFVPMDLAAWTAAFPAYENLILDGVIPTNLWDNRLINFAIPSLIELGAWGRPNIWLNIFYSETDARTIIPALFANYDPLFDIGYGHIGLYGYPKSVFTTPFFETPDVVSGDIVYLLVLGKVQQVGLDLNAMLVDNQAVWDASPNSTVYPTNVLSAWDQNDWQKHFGSDWTDFVNTKSVFDPHNTFDDQRSFDF